MYTTTRNDAKLLAQQIENLAREVQSKLDNGGDFLSVANELVRNSNTFVFSLGEIYALEQSGSNKKITTKTVYNPNYHNLRDKLGRFTKKI